MGTINADANTPSDYILVDLSPSTLRAYARPKERLLTPTTADMQVADVRLVPGDVMRVMIADSVRDGPLFAALASGGTVFQSVRVDSLGKISLPYVGHLQVANLTLVEVEARISKTLRGLISEPQVHVDLVGDLSGSVLVAGAVKAPGRFSALQGPLTLLDAINMAGGPIMEPHLANVVLRTGKSVRSFNYQELLSGNNVMVPPRSEIVLERAKKRFVAMGAVAKPGLHNMPSEFTSLLEALGEVGGLNERTADPRGVFVFRAPPESGDGENRPQVIRLNLREPNAIFLARQFLVLPDDAIYVTNSAVYEWQKIINPIVQTLILGRSLDVVQ